MDHHLIGVDLRQIFHSSSDINFQKEVTLILGKCQRNFQRCECEIFLLMINNLM